MGSTPPASLPARARWAAAALVVGLALASVSAGLAQIVPTGPVAPTGTTSLPVRLDCGHGPWVVGTLIFSGEGRDPAFGWFGGMVRNGQRHSNRDPWTTDFVEGDDATFSVALEPADSLYQFVLTLGDQEKARGPVRVLVEDRLVGTVATEPGQFEEIRFEALARGGRVDVRLQAEGCRGFALNGIEVSSAHPAWLGRLFPDEPDSVGVPPADSLPEAGLELQKKMLRDFCEFLLRESPRQGGFSYQGAWYQNAYAVRTLIAGSRILDEPGYAERAFALLDWFVSRQGPDGNWLSAYFGSQACDTVMADSSSANLADIGIVAFALAAAAPFASGERQAAYIAAAETYARKITLPNQRSDGAFPNGRWSGTHYDFPYTVSTASQCVSLAALYKATGKSEYLVAAEHGAGWLAALSFLDDGQFVLHPYNKEKIQLMPATDFGNVFYVIEALLWVREATANDMLRENIDTAIDNWLFGEFGVRSATVHDYWWAPLDPWSNSKMAGMLYVLARHPRRGTDPRIDTWLARGLAWMSDPVRSRTIGVLAHPSGARGFYSLAATSFAGIGVATAIDSSGTRY